MNTATERQAERIRVGAETVTFEVTGDASEGALLAMRVELPPGGGPPMLHRHDPFELYAVERGRLTIYLEDDLGEVERWVAQAGDVVTIPSWREHTVRNESEFDAEAWVVFTPAARMEQFARAAGQLDHAPTKGEVMALAQAHGIELTRPIEAVRHAI